MIDVLNRASNEKNLMLNLTTKKPINPPLVISSFHFFPYLFGNFFPLIF